MVTENRVDPTGRGMPLASAQPRCHSGFDGLGGAVRVTRVERRIRVVLDTQLNILGNRFSSNLSHDRESEVDTGRNAPCRDHVPIFDYACLCVSRAD